jgi:hypothetical protein
MQNRLTAIVKRAFGLQRPGRALKVYPDDTFLVSYPKSGNTWCRFLIANLLYPERQTEFNRINRIIPDPEITPKRYLDRTPRPRIIKSHHYFDPRYRRIIYIVRDPRDVVVSEYHFHRKRRVIEDAYPLEQFVTDFVRGQTSSSYGSWFDNVAGWLVTRHGHPGFLMLRYEDLLSDTVGGLEKIASFLNVAATPERLADAVQRSSADKMRNLEKSQAQEFSSTKGTRQDIPFVRAAGSGGWKLALSESSITEIELAWAPLIQWLGYELVSSGNDRLSSSTFQNSILGAIVR